MAERVDVVVVGAGLAGLSCARVVSEAGLTCVLLEASDGVGGRVRTDRVDGYLFDRGFQILLTNYPEARRQLDMDRLDLRAFESGAVVRAEGRWHRVADPRRRPALAFSSLTAGIGTLGDKARLLRLITRVLRSDATRLLQVEDRTAGDALRAEGFSDLMIERFFRPLFGGITLDPALGVSSRFFYVVLKSLTGGDSAVPAEGMDAIPRQLAQMLPEDIVRLNSKVDVIDGTAVSCGSGRVDARAVVVACEGPEAARLLGLNPVRSRPVSCVYFGAPSPPRDEPSIILDGDGDGPAAHAAVMTNVAPSYAPLGRALVSVACPGTVAPGLEAATRKQMRAWFGAEVDNWEVLAIYRIPHGHPDQSPPFSPKLPVRLGEGRFVAGDHRDTASIQGALYSGRRAGTAVLQELGVLDPRAT